MSSQSTESILECQMNVPSSSSRSRGTTGVGCGVGGGGSRVGGGDSIFSKESSKESDSSTDFTGKELADGANSEELCPSSAS